MNGLVATPFKLTQEEILASAASTLCLSSLEKERAPAKSVAEVALPPQYGYTASASLQPCGPRFVRITDIKGGSVDWERVSFCECKRPEPYQLGPGDILVARSGSVGKSFLVSDVSGPAVFASYMIRIRPKPESVPGYLYWCLQSQQFWQQVMSARRGSAMKNINGKMLASLRFPFPDTPLQEATVQFLDAFRKRLSGDIVDLPELPAPLTSVRRIVSRIEELAAKVEEARRLRGKVAAEMDALCQAIIVNPFDGAVTLTAMRHLVKQREPDVVVEPTSTYHFAGVYCFGGGVFPGQRKTGSEFSYRVLTRLRKGDFVYPKLMAWEGALGMVPDSCDSLHVSPEFPVFEVRQDRVLPEVLDTYFKMPSLWPELAAISTGTNVRRRRLHPSAFLQFEIPLPSMNVQRQLRLVKQRVGDAKRLQSETAAELNALMPSILAKAFRGEL